MPSLPQARILITNAEERAALAACRSLHAAGYAVSAAAFRTPFAAAHWSRTCTERLRMTDPGQDVDRFLADLEGTLRDGAYDVLLPGSDRALLAIASAGDRLSGIVRHGLPSHEHVRAALSRERLAQAAAEAGLVGLASIRCDSPEAARAAARELGYPVVVKAPDAVTADGSAIAPVVPTRWVRDERELALIAAPLQRSFLVQPATHGEVISFGGVMAGGRLLGVGVARYLRTWRPEAGNAAFAESMTAPDDLVARVARLVAALEWEGIFELELIRTAQGTFVPIDFNPRVYGSMSLAAAAGAPLAPIWCDWLLRRDPAPVVARQGRRYRWEDGEAAYLGAQLRARDLPAALRVLRPRRRVTHAQLQLADPLPFAARALQVLWRRMR